MKYKYCPICGHGPILTKPDDTLNCVDCGFVHYDNPIAVVSTLVAEVDPLAIPYGPNESLILVVRRAAPPFVGEWCLPCGYVNKFEHPKAAAVREVKEETNIDVRLEQILCVCNPRPGEINQMTIHYLARPENYELKAGDDATDAKWMNEKEIKETGLCFRSHQMVVEKWYSGACGEITGTDCPV